MQVDQVFKRKCVDSLSEVYVKKKHNNIHTHKQQENILVIYNTKILKMNHIFTKRKYNAIPRIDILRRKGLQNRSVTLL